jgi:AcrR family transcriptional regulator
MAHMNEKDRRVKRTQRLLGEALNELMLHKGYDAVTIRDITERADIAYATFFRHYKSKDDLLMQQIDGSLHDLEMLTAQLPGRYYLNEGILLFEHMRQNSDFYSRLFESATVGKRLRQRIAEDVLRQTQKQLAPTAVIVIPLEIVAHHIAASLLALMEWWLVNRQPYPPQRMGEIYEQLIIRAAYSAMSSEPPPDAAP